MRGLKEKNVVLIEKGGYYDPEDFNQRESSMMGLLWKNAGLQFNTDLSLLIAQGECLGGSTMINDAVCFDTPPAVKKQWREEYGVNIEDEKWSSAINEVEGRISVTPLTDDEVSKNKNGLFLKKACESHRPRYDGVNNKRNCIDCATCGNCHLGCHYQTKQDMVNTYIYRGLFAKNPNAFKIYCNCDVRKIEDENGTVTGVEGKFLKNYGTETFSLKVNAKVIILAAGSIASSTLLLNNNIASGKAGKGLALHPSTLLIGKFKDKEEVRASEGIPMAWSCTEFSVLNYPKNGKKKGGFMLESIFTPIYQFSLQLPWDIHENLMKDFQHYAMAGVMIRDDSIGKITLSGKGNPKIHYKLGDSEIQDLTDGIKTLAELFFDGSDDLGPAEKVLTGYGRGKEGTLTSRNEIDDLINAIKKDHNNGELELKLGSAHPQGGNLMGDDPATCVVDENCKVYDFRNLFVCDASVFPTSLGVNPQITVMALATMTAENILKTWDEKFEDVPLRDYLGKTCDIRQPMFCNSETLSIMFNQKENAGSINDLLNGNKAAQVGWLLDKNTLMIHNELHWRGFIPDGLPDFTSLGIDLNWITNYLEGFWKNFYIDDKEETIKGNLHVYLIPGKNIEIVPKRQNYDIFGDVIQLTYPSVSGVYDLIKIIDEDTIVGKVFLSLTNDIPHGAELTPFCMTKRYPVEYMDEDDHDRIFEGYSEETTLDENPGYWSLRIVKNHLLSPVLKVFHFSEDTGEPIPIDLLRQGMVEETGIQEKVGAWEHNVHKVNEDFLVGRFISPSFDKSKKVPPEFTEEVKEGGNAKKRFVIRYALSTVAGAWT